MRTIFAMIFVLALSVTVAAQNGGKKIESYTARNGVTYHASDTVRLYEGSANDGSFQFIKDKTETWWSPSSDGNAPKEWIGKRLLINNIKRNSNGVYFNIKYQGNFYVLLIDQAIKHCEIKPCTQVIIE